MTAAGKKPGGSLVTERMGSMAHVVDAAALEVEEKNLVERIWEHDHTVWKPVDKEIGNRLGWLHSPQRMQAVVDDLAQFVGEIRSEGFTDCLLLGMGGSSLAPEVCRSVFGVREGFLDVRIMDTTNPASVAEVSDTLRPESTLFLVSSKSGGTVETLSLMNYFFNLVNGKLGRTNAGRRFAAITDPGSGLEKTAGELGFRKVFLNDPEIGGRYAALSHVGLVPTALIGVETGFFLERAETVLSEATRRHVGPGTGDNSAAWLGAAMGACACRGRDKLTLIASPSIDAFSAWVEQLLAESTGKEGKGILPVIGEPIGGPGVYGDDRLFVYLKVVGDERFDGSVSSLAEAGQPVIQITMKDKYDLSGEYFRWEMATAVAGYFLGVNPFDQPDVESAKVRAKRAVEAFRKDGRLPARKTIIEEDGIEVVSDFTPLSVTTAIREFIEAALPKEGGSPGGPYVAIQAYLAPSRVVDRALDRLRNAVHKRFRIPVTVGYGPRFLHSTGQLHKGGPRGGLFIQLTTEPEVDIPIPDRAGETGSSVSFGVLIRAQALGDRQAMIDSGRDVLTIHLAGDGAAKIERLSGNL